ncbi:hypothetical protein [Aquipuribacter hungaricus]|uniref:Uncharacterized protein n=1 Tax=Aquipuribacter hungaricus TaxID=545624 RepID=A0ABV7WJC5_9MICO
MSTSWTTAARQVPGLDHDPCPGDVPGVRRLADGLRGRADRLAAAARAARGWDPGRWTGPSAGAAQATLAGLGDRSAGLGRSCADAATVLDGWAEELARLQSEAGALGGRALDNRRERQAAGVRVTTALALDGSGATGTVLGDQAALDRLEARRRELQQEAEELHLRWCAASRRWSARLDGAAPPVAAGWWRGAWDLAHDGYQHRVRQDARLLSWAAGATGAAAAVSGVVALVPAAAPVAVPLSLALGVASTQLSTQLAVGADGSPEAAVLGAATLGLGAVSGGLLRAAAETGQAVPRSVVAAGHVGEKGALLVDGAVVAGAATAPPGSARHGTLVDLDGHDVPVVVHDVDEPWQVGHGVRGAGFAGVATVPVPTPPPGGRTVPRPVRVPTPPAYRPYPVPAAPGPPTPRTAPGGGRRGDGGASG